MRDENDKFHIHSENSLDTDTFFLGKLSFQKYCHPDIGMPGHHKNPLPLHNSWYDLYPVSSYELTEAELIQHLISIDE